MPTAKPSRRWSGTETCDFCLQGYLVELERHCAHCDRGICAFCAQRLSLTGGWLCPDCLPGGREEDG